MPLTCPQCQQPIPPTSGESSNDPTCPFCAAPLDRPAGKQAETTTDDPRRTTPYQPQPRTPPFPAVPGYEILSVLGRGGMGLVYRARQTQLNRLVALKVIRSGEHAAPEELARFRVEAEAAARLQHPNVVQIYEIGEQDGRPFFSLELVGGGSLKERLGGTPQPPAEAARLAETLAHAVAAAHERGIVHRDLKPANVLLTEEGVPKVADFGLAKRLDDDSGQTVSGAILGTPSYMAPEQAAGQTRQIGPACDVYALGAILYEMLTGRPPFRGAGTRETLEQVCTQEPVPPSRLQPKTPRDLETICLKCLRKERVRRYASSRELADDLRRFLNGEPIHARPFGRLERAVKWARRRPAAAALLAVSAAALLALLGGGYTFLRFKVSQTEVLEKTNDDLTGANNLYKETNRQLGEERDHLARETNRALEAERDAEGRRQNAERKKEEARLATWRARNALLNFQFLRIAALWETDPMQAMDLLEDVRAYPFDLRDFTWHFCYGLCKRDRLHITARGSGRLSLAVNREGSLCALADQDGLHPDSPTVIRLIELPTGQERAVLRLATPWRPQHLALSPDGNLLASEGGAQGATVLLWDTVTGAQQAELEGLLKGVWCLTFSPDGKLVAAMDADGAVGVWSTATGQTVTRCQGGRDANGAALCFSEPGVLACSGGDGTIKLWEIPSGKARAPIPFPPSARLCTFTGRFAAFAGPEDLTVVDLVAGTKRVTKTDGKQATRLAVSPDGQHAALHGGGQLNPARREMVDELRIWNTATGRHELTLHIPYSPEQVVFVPGGKTLLSVSSGSGVTAWALRPEPSVPPLPGGGPLVFDAAGELTGFFRETRTAVVLADAKTALEVRRFEVGGRIGSLGLSRDGKLLTVLRKADPDARMPGEVQVWDVGTGQRRQTVVESISPTFKVATLAPDNGVLATGTEEGVQLWDLASGRELRALDCKMPHGALLAFAPDGRTLACGAVAREVSAGNSVVLWDVATGREVRAMPCEQWLTGLVYSPDGKLLAAGGGEELAGSLQVWEAATGKKLVARQGPFMQPRALAFTPDSAALATCHRHVTPQGTSYDGEELRLWDAQTGFERLAVSQPGQDSAFSVSFTPDGNGLVWGNGKWTRLWERSPGARQNLDFQHPAPAKRLAYLPDSKGFVTEAGEKVYLWDTATGERRAVLPGKWFALSADGETLATAGGSLGDEVKIWDSATGAERGTFSLPGTATVLTLSPDGGLLAVAGGKVGEKPPQSGHGPSTVHLWDLHAGGGATVLPVEAGPVSGLYFPPGQKQLLIGCGDDRVRVWDLVQRRFAEPLQGKCRLIPCGLQAQPEVAGGPCWLLEDLDNKVLKRWDAARGTFEPLAGEYKNLSSVWLSADGATAALSTIEEVCVVDPVTGRRRLVIPRTAPAATALSPDGRWLITGAVGEFTLWDTTTGKDYRLDKQSSPVSVAAFSPDGKTLLGSWNDGRVRLWDVAAARSATAPAGEPARPLALAFTPDGGTLAVGSWGGRIKLYDLLSGNERLVLQGHHGRVLVTAISPDGRLLATGGQDGSIRLWELPAGQERGLLGGHQKAVTGLAFGPDGAMLASAGEDGSLRLWDVAGKREPRQFDMQGRAVWCVAVAPDGRTLASGDAAGGVTLWDVAGSKERRTLAGHECAVWAVTFTPDGVSLASGDRNGTVRLWDTASGRTTHTARTEAITTLAFGGGGGELACGTSVGRVLLWSPATGRQQLLHHYGWVGGLQFREAEHALAVASPDGRVSLHDTATGQLRALRSPLLSPVTAALPDGTLFAASYGNSVSLRAPGTGKQIEQLQDRFTLRGHSLPISVLALSADGRRLASGGEDATVRLWDTATGKALAVLHGHTLSVRGLAFSRDGKLLASGGCDTTVRLWDVTAGTERAVCRAHTSTVSVLAFSGDGITLASGSSDGSVCLWDPVAGKLRRRLEGLTGKMAGSGIEQVADATDLALNGDGSLLALVIKARGLKVVDTATGAERGSATDAFGPLLFSGDGKLLVTGGGLGLRVWGTDPLKESLTLKGAYATALAFSPDGKTLRVSLYNENFHRNSRWDLMTGKEFAPWVHQLPIYSLAMTPDGKTLASAGTNNVKGELKVWNTVTESERFTVVDAGQVVSSVAFSHDGKRLAAGGYDGSVRLWEVSTGKELPGPPRVIGGITSVAFTPDDKTLAIGRRWYLQESQSWALRDVQLWDLEASKERTVLVGHQNGVTQVAVSADGKRLASGSLLGEVKIWDLATGEELFGWLFRERLNSLAFSPDGKLLVAGSSVPRANRPFVGVVKVWDAETGEERLSREGGDVPTMAVVFSRDGKTVVASDTKGFLRGWDVNDGKSRFAGQASFVGINALLFTPDGKQLITAGEDRRIRFWDANRLESDFPVQSKP